MKKIIFLQLAICFLTITFFCSCKKNDDAVKATATIQAKNDSGIAGTIEFSEKDGMVTMKAEISNLALNLHAIHIHAIGDCSAADGTSAGGHWNPTNVDHGQWGSDSFHIGDIGNLNPNEDGTAILERETDLWCLTCDDENKNVVGKAIIIHEGPDDFTSQPSGAAGPRIGCAEIALD